MEKSQGDWDKNKRDFIDELKQRNAEIDSLKQKLKSKDVEVQQANERVL